MKKGLRFKLEPKSVGVLLILFQISIIQHAHANINATSFLTTVENYEQLFYGDSFLNFSLDKEEKKPVIKNVKPIPNVFSDYDGDGINDEDDLDDDNDGISDIDEGKGGGTTSEFTTKDRISLSGFGIPSCSDRTNYFQNARNDGYQVYWWGGGNNCGSSGTITILGLQPGDVITYDVDISNYYRCHSSNQMTAKVSDEANNNVSTTSGSGCQYQGKSKRELRYGVTGVAKGSTFRINMSLTTTRGSSSLPPAWTIIVRNIKIESTGGDLDTDKDGLPDYQDLDSDGDGCPDAIEGSGNIQMNDLKDSSISGGNSGSQYNGTSSRKIQLNLGNNVNSTGKPKLNNSAVSQNIGSSRNVSSEPDGCIICGAGYTKPKFSKSQLTNNCPSTEVNVPSYFTGDIPSNAKLIYSTDNDPSDGLSDEFTANQLKAIGENSIYYAYYYHSGDDCYSPGTKLTVKILSCNEAPSITNNKGKPTNATNYKENETDSVINMNATDPDGEKEGAGLTWKIKGGTDAADFTIDENDGRLRFKKTPDFENPHDSNKDNVYNVVVEVKDTPGASAEQEQIITVKDVNECLENKFGPECDFDEDGIANKDDLDDDNDGILDTKEISIYGISATQKGGAKNIDRANKIPDGKYAILGKGDFVTIELTQTLNKGDISTIYWRKTNGKGRIRVDYSSNGSTFTNLTKNLNISTRNKILPRNITIPKDGVTHIRIRRTGKGVIGLDAIVSTGGDQDNDGFLDQFDADSDGDGCFDAIESGGVDANNDGFLDGTGISDKGLVVGGNGGYDGGTIIEYEAIEITVDTKGLKNKKVNATTGLELFVTGEASSATSYENGAPVYGTKGNANATLAYQWYLEEGGNLNKLSNNTIYEGVTTEKLRFKEDLAVAEYKYVLEVTNNSQACFEESYNVRVTVDCEIKGEAIEILGISPTTCTPANDGKIEISNINLLPNTIYRVNYKKVGGNNKEKEFSSDSEGKLTIEGLSSGVYTDLRISSLNNSSCGFTHFSEVTVPEKDITYFEVNSAKVDESYIKAKDGVIEVGITGLSNFTVSVKNENGEEMPKVSDYSYESLAPGIYRVKVTDNDTNCSQEEEVEIRAALPPDFEIGFRQLNTTVSLFNIGENPINFILRIGEIENERSNPEPIRIIIAKIPHFKLKYDATLTKLGGVRRLRNKEWQVSENDKAYFLTYTPSNSSDEIKNEVHDIGVTGSFEITPESVPGIVNLLIAIDQESGGEENPKNNLIDIPVTIKAE